MKHEVGRENLRFGSYLRKLREEKKFSLDTVSELSTRYPEQLTKSHLSRIENGQALPNVPRLLTLSQVYGISLSTLAERYEIEFVSSGASCEFSETSTHASIIEEGRKLEKEGLFLVALHLYEEALHRLDPSAEQQTQLRIRKIVCLAQSEHFRASKEECEDLLSENLALTHQLELLNLFASSCYRLKKYSVAMFAIDRARSLICESGQGADRHVAALGSLEGELYRLMGDGSRSYEMFTEASRMHAELGNQREFLRAKLGMANALAQSGKRKSAKIKYLEVLRDSEAEGLLRNVTITLSNLAEISFLDGEFEKAEHYAMKSNRFARPMEFQTVLFRNSFYLWKIAKTADDEQRCRRHIATLKKYFPRIDKDLDEAKQFEAFLEGEEK